MNRYNDCRRYDDCDYRNDIGECPDDCNQFKHKDNVRVVRCKDCRHMTKELGYRYCNVWERINGHGDDGFCCYGERRSE